MFRFPSRFAALCALTTATLAEAQEGTSTLQFFCGDIPVTMQAPGGLEMESRTPLVGACLGTLGDHELRIRRNSISLDGTDYDVAAGSRVDFRRIAWDGWYLEVDGTRIAENSPVPGMEAAIAAGDVEASLALASAYLNGSDWVEQDATRAAELFTAAATEGNAVAQRILAFLYFDGEGVEVDPAEGMRWAEMAADQGDVRAQRLMGYGLYNAEGAARDVPRALEYWSAAADGGDADAAYNMGVVIQSGTHVTFDRTAAIAWLELAEELGHADAPARLAELREAAD